MARTERVIATTPERIFAVLSDADSYGDWVVGSDTIRDADPGWPAVGTRFHHRVGWGPLKIDDHTEVVDADPPHCLQLRAKARPLGTASVTLRLAPERDGTRVTMIEDAGDKLTMLVFNPLTHLIVRGRNAESLRRLDRLATGRRA